MRVDVRGVHKTFGKMEALRGIDLSIPSGRRVALVGPNGSGKSTLTRVIMGLLECRGEVWLDGRPPFEDRRAVASRMAYVPQVAPALAAPVDDILHLVGGTRGIAREALRQAALRFDLDVDPISSRPFRLLSGGMKQKLLLALAFAARPSLLILDEPTSSLDAGARDRFLEAVAELPAHTTVLLCSHRPDEVMQLAERVIALEEGRIVHDGPATGSNVVPPQLRRAHV